jgi:hypothetical protein
MVNQEIKTGVWNHKIRLCICERDGCTNEFERKPHTGRKYCDAHMGTKVYVPKPRPPRPMESKACANPVCNVTFETNHPTKKYHDRDCQYNHERALRKLERMIPLVDHKDGCHCGGCLGVESRRK